MHFYSYDGRKMHIRIAADNTDTKNKMSRKNNPNHIDINIHPVITMMIFIITSNSSLKVSP